MKKLVLLLTSFVMTVFVLGGCTPSRMAVKAFPIKDQEVMYKDGHESIISTKQNLVAVKQVGVNRPIFEVVIQNKTDKPVNFGQNDISAKQIIFGTEPIVYKLQENFPIYTSGVQIGDKIVSINDSSTVNISDVIQKIKKNNEKSVLLGVERKKQLMRFNVDLKQDENGTYKLGLMMKSKNNTAPLRIIPYQEALDEIETKAKRQQFAMALAGALNSYSASMSAGKQYNYGNVGGYNYSSYSYNPSAAKLASDIEAMKMQKQMQDTQSRAELELAQISREFLKIETVMPGSWYGGKVMLEQPSTDKDVYGIVLNVMLNGEDHEFNFTQAKIK